MNWVVGGSLKGASTAGGPFGVRGSAKMTSSPAVASPGLGYWVGRLLPWISPGTM